MSVKPLFVSLLIFSTGVEALIYISYIMFVADIFNIKLFLTKPKVLQYIFFLLK